jgi:hypothetical protein
VVTVIPSVWSRAEALRDTVRQLERLGLPPLVTVQAAEEPTNHRAQRRTADRAVALGLHARPDATHLLYVEDDADICPSLATRLPQLLAADVAVTLFTAARYYHPAWVNRALDAGRPIRACIDRLRSLRIWVGTIAVLLPRRIAEGVRDWPSPHHGWDVHLREYLRAHGEMLYVALPNLAQHRDIGSTVGSRRGVVSVTFGWPAE